MGDEVDKARADLVRLVGEAEQMQQAAQSSTGGALVPVGKNLPAKQVKTQMARVRSGLVKKRAEIEKARRELEERMRDEMHELMQIVGPMQEQIARMEEGIWTVNLYLGRDEEIVTLRDGEPALASEPIVARQMVLSMDEEAMIAAEEGGMDHHDIESFDEWLLSDPDHLDQVLPETRGVVVLMPRAKGKQYVDDPWLNAAMNEGNFRSYWLIRNGEKVYRMVTDFNCGKTLVPMQDEFTKFFEREVHDWEKGERVRQPLKPGSSEWMKAEKAADARQRHYMRVALIMQGLVERTTVFHPLPAPDISFLGPEAYDAGYVRIVTDAEFALTTGRESFREWQTRLNAELRTGMRIVGNFRGEGWRAVDEAYDYAGKKRYGEHSRRGPVTAPDPPSNTILTIEKRKNDGGLVCFYERTDMKRVKRWVPDEGRPGWGWERYVEEPYKTRASVTVYPEDRFILPFDLVDIPTMETLINSRLERTDYLDMVPTIKAAIIAKQEEYDLEAPFRMLIRGQAASGEVISEEEVASLVDWWKISNRWHRPLVAPDKETQAKALLAMKAEYRRRQQDSSTAVAQAGVEEKMLAGLKANHPEALLIARKRDGKFIVLDPADDGNIWVHRSTYGLRSAAKREEWVLPGPTKALRVLHEAKRWAGWDLLAAPANHLTGPEVESVVAQIRKHFGVKKNRPSVAKGPLLAIVLHQPDKHNPSRRSFEIFFDTVGTFTPPEFPITAGRVSDDAYAHGSKWERKGKGIEITYSGGWDAHHYSWSWRNMTRGGKVQEYAWHQHGGTVIYEDDKAIADRLLAQKAIDEFTSLASSLSQQSNLMQASIVKQWLADAEAMHYARFLEDYDDPDLWEGHRKTLKIEYPFHAGFGNRDADFLDWVCDRLVESGFQIEGMTVAEARDLYLAKVKGSHKRDVVVDQWKTKRKEEIPEEILGYRLLIERDEDEPEDDEEEDVEEPEDEPESYTLIMDKDT